MASAGRPSVVLVGSAPRDPVFRTREPLVRGRVRGDLCCIHVGGAALAALVGAQCVSDLRSDRRRTAVGDGTDGAGGGSGCFSIRTLGQQCPGPLPAPGVAAAY